MTFLKRKLKRVRPLLGTYVEIELQGAASEKQMNAWITAGFEAVEEIDRLMSFHRMDSDLTRLNRSTSGTWISVHPHTIKVLEASNELFHVSKGVFDIRCSGRRTSDAAPVRLRGRRVSKTGPWTMDLGGIAKGYSVDYAMEKIRRQSRGHGISGVVNAGGDLRRWGKHGMPIAVATSAVRTNTRNERLTEADHVLMPEGKSLKKARAVSVISESCLWSDALTKVMLLGTEPLAKTCLARYGAKGIHLA